VEKKKYVKDIKVGSDSTSKPESRAGYWEGRVAFISGIAAKLWEILG
jgi:hypothetical protein